MHLRQPVIGLAARTLFVAMAFSVRAQALAGVPPQSVRPSAANVQALLDDGRYARAEERARELVSPASLEGCEKSLEVAEHLRLLARAMWLNGKQADPETRRIAELALATAIEVAGEPSLAAAESRFDIALLCFTLGDHAGARAGLENALGQKKALLGQGHPEVAKVLAHLGYLAYQENRDIEEARRLFARSRAIQDATLDPDHLDVAHRWGREAIVLEAAGDWSGARANHERAIAIYERRLRPGHPLTAVHHHNMGSFCRNQCDWPGAAHHLEKALEARRTELGETHINVAWTMSLLAKVRDHLGDADEALSLWQRSLDSFEKSLGPNDQRLLLPLQALARAHLASGDLAAAEREVERAHAILPEGGPGEASDLASIERLRAELAWVRGDRALALGHLDRAIALLEDVPFPDEEVRTGLLGVTGRLLAGSEDPVEIEKGIGILTAALDLERQVFQAGSPRLAETLDALATALSRGERHGEAFARALEAGAIARVHLQSTAARFEERNALGDAANALPGLALTLQIAAHEPAPGRVRAAWDVLVRSRSLVFDEMAARRRLAALSNDPKIGALAQTLAQAREHYAELAVRGEADPTRAAWRELLSQARTAREHAERDLAQASAVERASRMHVDAGFAEVVAALPAGVALVSFALVASPASAGTANRASLGYIAFSWLPGATEPAVVVLGDADLIDEQVARVLLEGRSSVREAEYRHAAGLLRERIWDPLELSLSGAREICVVPDGALVLVDLSALPTGDDGYLIERAPPIHYLSTERDLLPEEGEPIGRGLLAFGGPDFDRASDVNGVPALLAEAGAAATPAEWTARGMPSAGSASLSELKFTTLPAAASEALQVASLWDEHMQREREAEKATEKSTKKSSEKDPRDAILRTGAGATEAGFERLARGRAVLHLATHGFFLPSTGGTSAISGRGVQPGAFAPTPAALDLALASDHSLLSGLAFAGANLRTADGTGEDGILLAEEICALDLSGVRLAVLSACDTGLGQVQDGEGVFGLRRAFQIAGVRTLVTSLWPVEDRTTEVRMLEFYRGWLQRNESVAQALRSAALRLLQDRRARGESTHPYHWAGFVAVGGRN